ncbi:hypothetical protein [Rhodococcus jostii]|uniref:hypothetical protein n=1 Tax=Rhodococcus jostii TaxID=132919 RepID=UPI00031585C1|nr:hypothetical protein [Rhodococcus jostii]
MRNTIGAVLAIAVAATVASVHRDRRMDCHVLDIERERLGTAVSCRPSRRSVSARSPGAAAGLHHPPGRNGKSHTEVVYAVTSLSAVDAHLGRVATWLRGQGR